MSWHPIDTAPKGELLLYFPPVYRMGTKEAHLHQMTKVDLYPVCYPRKPTHWMPIPEPPK